MNYNVEAIQASFEHGETYSMEVIVKKYPLLWDKVKFLLLFFLYHTKLKLALIVCPPISKHTWHCNQRGTFIIPDRDEGRFFKNWSIRISYKDRIKYLSNNKVLFYLISWITFVLQYFNGSTKVNDIDKNVQEEK